MEFPLPESARNTEIAISPNGKHVAVVSSYAFIKELTLTKGQWKVTDHEISDSNELGDMSNVYVEQVAVSNNGKLSIFYIDFYNSEIVIMEKKLHSNKWSKRVVFDSENCTGLFYSSYDNELHVVVDMYLYRVADKKMISDFNELGVNGYITVNSDNKPLLFEYNTRDGLYSLPSPSVKRSVTVHVPYSEYKNAHEAIVRITNVHSEYILSTAIVDRPCDACDGERWMPSCRVSDNAKLLWVDINSGNYCTEIYLYRLRKGGINNNNSPSEKFYVKKLRHNNSFAISGNGRRIVFINIKGILEIKDY